MHNIAFNIGNFQVHWYGIFYLITFLSGYIFLIILEKKKFLPLSKEFYKFLKANLDNLFLAIFLGIIIGGRLGHCIIYDFKYCFQNPINILKIREGGMAFLGGIFGVAIALFIMKKKFKLTWKLLLEISDITVIFATIGIILGRIGNFLNQELIGIPIPGNYRNLPLNLVETLKNLNLFYVYSSVDNVLRVNYNFMASFFEGVIPLTVLIIFSFIQLKKQQWKVGQNTGIFLILYGFFRFFLEYFKNKARFEYIGPLIKSQYFFIILVIIGIYLLKKSKNLNSKK